jgi:outer membrane protein assembly factor BamB
MISCGMLLLAGSLGFSCSEPSASRTSGPSAMRRMWTTTLTGGAEEGRWTGTPVVTHGLAIFGVRGGLAAFDTAAGRQAWRATLWPGGNHTYGDVRQWRDEVCVEDWPAVGCVDAATGKVLWTKAVLASTANCETAFDSSAWYVGTDSHMVYAFDPATGRQLWATDINPGTKYSSRVYGFAVSSDTLYATTVRLATSAANSNVGDLVGLDRNTGRILFTYTTPGKGGFQGRPAIQGRLAIMNDGYASSLVAIDRFTQQEAWRTASDPSGYINSETSPILVGDTVFAASSDTQVYSINANNGAMQWRAVGVVHGSLGSLDVCGPLLLTVEFGGGNIIAVDRRTHVSGIVGSIPRDVHSRIGVADGVAYFETTTSVSAYRC